MAGSGGNETISTQQVDPDIKSRNLALYDDAMSYIGNSPYTPYPYQQVAGFQPYQSAAFNFLGNAVLPGYNFNWTPPNTGFNQFGGWQAPQTDLTRTVAGQNTTNQTQNQGPGGYGQDTDGDGDVDQDDQSNWDPQRNAVTSFMGGISGLSAQGGAGDVVTLDNGQQVNLANLRAQGLTVENRGTATQPNLVINGQGIGSGSQQLYRAAASNAGYIPNSYLSQGVDLTPYVGFAEDGRPYINLRSLEADNPNAQPTSADIFSALGLDRNAWATNLSDTFGPDNPYAYETDQFGRTIVNRDVWNNAGNPIQSLIGPPSSGMSDNEATAQWVMSGGYQPGTTRGDLAVWARDNGVQLPPTSGSLVDWANANLPGGAADVYGPANPDGSFNDGSGVITGGNNPDPNDPNGQNPYTGGNVTTGVAGGGVVPGGLPNNNTPGSYGDFTNYLPGGQQQGVGFQQLYDAANRTGLLGTYSPNQLGTDFQAQQVTPSSFLTGNMAAYMNPYTDQVIDQSINDLNRARQIAQIGNAGAAVGAGAFGGSRHGVADAESNRAYLDSVARTTAQLRNQGFENAAGRMDADLQRQMQAGLANQSAGLQASGLGLSAGMANQAAGLQSNAQNLGAAAQLGQLGGALQDRTFMAGNLLAQLGGMQQAQAQSMIDADRAQFYEARNDPIRALQLRQGILSGMPVGMSQTTYQPTSGVGGFLQGALGGAGTLAGLGPWGAGIGALGGGLLSLF